MTGRGVGRPWPVWLTVVLGAIAVPLAVALVAAPGLAVAWLLLSGSRLGDIARPMAAWVAASGVVGFAAGGWLTGRLAGARGSKAVGLGVVTGAWALALVVALVVVGMGDALALRPTGVALGIVEPTPSVPSAVPGWVEAAAPRIGPPEQARERAIAAIGYLVAAAALSLGAAGLGGMAADGEEADDGAEPAGSWL